VIAARIKWSDLRRDDYLKKMIRADSFIGMINQLGIDEDQVAEIAVFSDLETLNNPGVGMLVRGVYNIRTVTGALASRGWTQTGRGGYRLYSRGNGREWAAPLKSGILVVGSRQAVEGVINTEITPSKGIASNALLSRLVTGWDRKDYIISMAMALPRHYQAAGDVALKAVSFVFQLKGLGPFGSVLEKIGFARGLACSISHRGNSVPVEIKAVMKDAGSAGLVSGGLSLLKSLSAYKPTSRMTEQERETMLALQSLSVASQGTTVTVRLVMPERFMSR
jgi:hypothetical protein